ncbi:putative repeat protein (TIGR01451 family)/LPXTG-motif cell wall-anchored protein [Microbacterium sp. W4I4]|uniref:DUF7927 domain-containing protein n=1 Tax=Microbacterium sp. W4I4 TaxID=3042295 RepID=UPI00277DA289|nr:LPXTG cell wall anchor domain-containing protein [Microbacterium sp. W4I4]MDQ0614159.1 putative repeat protein (TIGR01451 family)/LPXTG-motif cell wall-anchored protein [Microbacterium sp. W4I4]
MSLLARLMATVVVTASLGTGVFMTAAPASAAAGDAFDPATPLVFIAQKSPTQLFTSVVGSDGTVTFQDEGPASAINYNAIAYNTVDNYIYAIGGIGTSAAIPVGSLLRIGQDGVVTRVGTQTYGASLRGAFGADGFYYIEIDNQILKINTTSGAIVSRQTLTGAAMVGADFTFLNGYLWSFGNGAITRTNPLNGVTLRWPLALPGGNMEAAGAAWTYGNGNLGFSLNAAGTVLQVAVASPAAATPTFTLVSTQPGPSSSNNDGASSPGAPVDLAIAKSGPESVGAGGSVTYELTVTNNGPGVSSGYIVKDTIPAPLTGATTPDSACTVTAGTLTCTGGRLAVGASAIYTVTASAPSGATSGTVTNTATVAGNERDLVSANNTSDHTMPLVPLVTCAADGNRFNTGYSAASGGILPDNAKDANWQVSPMLPATGTVSPPPADTSWARANVGNMAPGAWPASPYGNAQWISRETIANPSQGPASGDWYYRYQFQLDDGVDAGKFALSMNFLADNTVAEVFVNGIAQSGKTTGLPQTALTPPRDVLKTGSYYYGGFALENAAQTTLASDWKTGLNTIIVQIQSGPGFEGFLAQMRPSALCPQPAYTVTKSASADDVQLGDTLTYTIEVANTGNVPFTAETPATVVDDLTGVLDDAAYNGDAAVSFSGSTSSDAPTVSGAQLRWAGPLEVGETATITYSVTVRDRNVGDGSLDNTVVPGELGECVRCSTTTPVQSFSVVKSADATEVVTGDVITYTLSIRNTGKAPYTTADPAALTDDMSEVLDDASYNGDATGGAVFADPTLSWSGALAVGETRTITYSVTVGDASAGGDRRLNNAVITTNGGDCPAGTDNVACNVRIPSGAYTVVKTASESEVEPGETITYTVTVSNTGQVDYTAAEPASFKDDLSGVLDDAAYNGDATGGATLSGGTLSWEGALAVGETKTVTYSVTVNDPDLGDRNVRNAVRPASPGGVCEQVEDCITETAVRTLTLSKTSSATGPVQAGDVVTYTITARNSGTADYTAQDPASFEDDLSGVLDDAVYNDDVTGGASVAGSALTWAGPLAAGESVQIVYSVTVGAAGSGDGEIRNAVIGTVPGSTCDGDCITENPVRGYTLAKSSDPAGDVSPGQTVTYRVVVANVGAVDYTDADPASFTDDLSKVLDDATYNEDADGEAVVSGDVLSWTGELAAGESITITYSVTVNPVGQGDGILTNAVVPTGPGGDCDVCGTSNPVKAFAFEKLASTSVANPGDEVVYTITARNTGAAAYTAADPAVLTDDLSGVLDDAVYNGDATDGAVFTEPTLAWALELPVGATKTVTYTVTVGAHTTGDQHLRNVVSSPDPSGACTEPDGCFTDTPTRSFGVTKTASTDSVKPGEKVTYTVVVTNTGEAAYTDDSPAAFTDDMSAVLDDASFNDDATGGALYAAPRLTWAGPLEVGASATITYSVTVKAAGAGDGKLENVIVTPAGGNCLTGADDDACGTTTTVDRPGTLPQTGQEWNLVGLVGGAAALLAGLALILIRRRREAI